MSDAAALGLPYIASNGHGGHLCSACGGGVRSDATTCKHCRVVFVDVARAQTIYQEALQELKANPTSADLRQRAQHRACLFGHDSRQAGLGRHDLR